MGDKAKGTGFFPAHLVNKYGGPKVAIWASIALLLIGKAVGYAVAYSLSRSRGASQDKGNGNGASKGKGAGKGIGASREASLIFSILMGAWEIGSAALFGVLIFSPDAGVPKAAAVAAWHAIGAGTAYALWGMLDRCATPSAATQAACGDPGCLRSVSSWLLPLSALGFDMLLMGLAVALIATGSRSCTGRVASAVSAVAGFAAIAVPARVAVEASKLLFDYESALVSAFGDRRLRDSLAACQRSAGGASGGSKTCALSSEVPADAPRYSPDRVAVATFKSGVRRAMLESSAGILAAAAALLLYRALAKNETVGESRAVNYLSGAVKRTFASADASFAARRAARDARIAAREAAREAAISSRNAAGPSRLKQLSQAATKRIRDASAKVASKIPDDVKRGAKNTLAAVGTGLNAVGAAVKVGAEAMKIAGP